MDPRYLTSGGPGPHPSIGKLSSDAVIHVPFFLLAVGTAGSMFASRFGDPFEMAVHLPRPARWVLGGTAAILPFSFAPEIRQPFIYFQF